MGFFNTQICFLANEDDNMNFTYSILQRVNDEDESGSWMQEVEEMLKFLMRNQGCSCMLLYYQGTTLATKQIAEKTGDFFSCFQVTVYHHGMSEKKARGRKWIPDPGGVLPTVLLPRLTLVTLLIHPRHTSVQGQQGHCVPLQCSPASTIHQWNEMPQDMPQPIQLSFLLSREHKTTKTSPEKYFSYEYGYKLFQNHKQTNPYTKSRNIQKKINVTCHQVGLILTV